MKRFNLSQLITHHNQQYPRKRISPDKTWGFIYLSPEGLTLLNTMLKTVVSINTQPSLRTHVKNLDKYRQSVLQLHQTTDHPDFFRQVKKLCQSTRTLLTASKLHDWESRQADWLSLEDNWSYLMDLHPETKGSLVKLKQFWQKQQKFCCASNDFLLNAIQLLKEVQSQFDKAEKEYIRKRYDLPAFIAESYGAYLNFLKLELKLTKQSLLNTMLSRLTVAEKLSSVTANVNFDDVLVYTIQELQHIGVLKESLKVKGYWQTLEPHHFNAFHQTIEREGNAAMRKQLSELAWFTKSSTTIETSTRRIGKQLCIVPIALDAFVPKEKSWPAWLFPNQSHCIEFIKSQQATFANLKLGYSTMRAVDPKERFQQLDNYQQHVETAAAELQKCQPKIWQIWSYFGYRQCIITWQKNIKAQIQFCIEERIKLLEEIALHELPPKTREEQYQLWLLSREQLSCFTISMPPTLVQRVNAVEKVLTRNLNQEPGTFALYLIQAIAEKETLTENEITYLIEFIENNNLSPEKNHWLQSITPYTKKVITTLLFQTKQLFAKDDTALVAGQVVQSLKLIQILSEEHEQTRLHQALRQLLFLQTPFLYKEPASAGLLRLQAIQKLIFEFGDETTKHWFTTLDTAIGENQWNRFLTHWQNKIKELPMPGTSSVKEFQAPPPQYSSPKDINPIYIDQPDKLPASLPLFESVPLQPQLY